MTAARGRSPLGTFTWTHVKEIERLRQRAFADPLGLQVIRIESRITHVQLPPPLPSMPPRSGNEDPWPFGSVEEAEASDPLGLDAEDPARLVEVADIDRAARQLEELGFVVGDVMCAGWDAAADIDLLAGGCRLVGVVVPDAGDGVNDGTA